MDSAAKAVEFATILSLLAIVLSVLACWFAFSARGVQLASRSKQTELQDAIDSVGQLEKKTDKAVAEKVTEYLRLHLGKPESVAAFSAAILNHPSFLDEVVSTFTDMLSNGDDRLTSALNEKLTESAVEITPEMRDKVKEAVAEYVDDNVSDLITNDDDVINAIGDSIAENIPVFIKELFASDEQFRNSVHTAVTERVLDVIQGEE